MIMLDNGTFPKRFTWKEGDSLRDMWFNGEALIMAVIDGEMKYWIK